MRALETCPKRREIDSTTALHGPGWAHAKKDGRPAKNEAVQRKTAPSSSKNRPDGENEGVLDKKPAVRTNRPGSASVRPPPSSAPARGRRPRRPGPAPGP